MENASSLLLALFLALMVWLLTSDTERPMQTAAFPTTGGLSLRFDHVPPGYQALSPDEGKVRVVVRGFKDAVGALGSADVGLTVDLAALTPAQIATAAEAPLNLPVSLHWSDGLGWARRRRMGLRVIGTEPAAVAVRLDPVVTSTLRVEVELSMAADGGIELGESEASPATVQVTGPRSVLSRIARAVALVDSSVLAGSASSRLTALPLVAMDASGAVVGGVTFEPSAVAVTVDPASFGYRLPVVVEPRGNVPAGYDWRGITYEPKEVHVFGSRDGIQLLLTAGKVNARPIDLGPITQTTRLRSPLLLPPGIQAVGLRSGEITVTVQVDVLPGSQQYTVPVVAEGVPPGQSAAISPPTVLVVLRGDRPVLDRLSAADIKAVINARRLAPGVHRVQVELRLPAGLERVSIAPEMVEVQLEPTARSRPGG